MSTYRAPGPLARLAPPAPWWRLLGAWWRDVPQRLEARRHRREERERLDRFFAVLGSMRVWGGP